MIRIQLRQSGTPVYRQIADQIKQMAAAGTLAAGQQLDTVRNVATRLRVNPMTVAKAYARLVAEGVAVGRQGKGVFLATGGSPLSYAARRRALAGLIEQVVAEAYQLDVSSGEVAGMLRDRFAEVEAARAGSAEPASPAPSQSRSRPARPATGPATPTVAGPSTPAGESGAGAAASGDDVSLL